MPQVALKICVATFTAVTLAAMARPAEAQPFAPAADALLSFQLQMMDKTIDRSRLARLVLNYCNEVLKVLPRNTPQEDNWVEGEINSLNWDRIMRASKSIERARQSLVFSFQDCASHTAKITKLISPQPATEAVLWTRLAMVFSDSDEKYAVRIGLVRNDEKGGLIDPHRFESLSLIRHQSLIAVIESLGQKP